MRHRFIVSGALLLAACEPELSIDLREPDVPAAVKIEAGAYAQTLTSGAISFRVVAAGDGGSERNISIAPAGFEEDNTIVSRTTFGEVVGSEIADLDGNGFPEVYVFVRGAGSGSYGEVIAYASNKNKSMSEVYLSELSNSSGYMGHDIFTLEGNFLLRKFPVYKDGDSNAEPTGGVRQIRYKLKPGEAGWVLVEGQITASS